MFRWLRNLFYDEPNYFPRPEYFMEPRISGTKPLFAGGAYTSPAGYFGLIVNNKLAWYGCRETFHSIADPKKLGEFYYRHDNTATDVAHFIYAVENHLHIYDKSNFMFTERANVSWVSTSPWWLSNPMRYSFFTGCLRASLGWVRSHNKDWRSMVEQCKYFFPTKYATNRFLSGFTHYTGNVRGWHRQFTGADQGRALSDAQINNLLVSPGDERYNAIQRVAYFKWLASGQPWGRDGEFWDAATREVDKV